ncbi:SGNH/GDSL hydrolase family protein [Dyadobacter chenwenxiniae]|uniref:SGNH/GDSL hydrolase family protein n=1 Tax=Dyadobacter chenwenxiniae TaxID=2906456 RepID=A0A9X1PHE5_9BACT|nr:SGNH/GDSL hydrolase family protein [Dyadobacter chenwenxiniae]MCF0059924.1 SGNH/GDSL hydrolase family protein [Dyadobacter chenwenxiniae]UON85663.1 SGNH/GDSL hydrolase family protein [Dyadobacter chenwenxiniae]
MNNQPRKVADLTAFIENPFPIIMQFLKPSIIVAPVVVELWSNKAIFVVVPSSAVGANISFTLTVAWLRVIENAQIYVKFAGETKFSFPIKTTLDGAVSSESTFVITAPSIGTVRVSSFSDEATAAKALEAIQAAEEARGYRDEAKDLVASAGTGIEQKGMYNWATNTPTLSADATIGQTDPEKYQIYDIPATGVGLAQFSGKNFTAGDTMGEGKLKQDPSGQWFFIAESSSLLAKLDAQFSLNSSLVGPSVVSTYTTNSTSGSTTRILGQNKAGLLETITVWITRGGILEVKIFRKNPDTSYNLINTFYLLTKTGQNNFSLANGDFPEVILLDTDYLGWHHAYVNSSNNTAFVGFKNEGPPTYFIAGNAAGTNLDAAEALTTSFGFNYTVSVGVTAARQTQSNAKITANATSSLSAEESSRAYLQESPDVVSGVTDSLSTYTLTPSEDVTRIYYTPLTAGYIKAVQLWATRAGDITFFIFSKNANGTFNIVTSFEVTAVLGLNTIAPADTVTVKKGEYWGWYVNNPGGQIGYKATAGTIYPFLAGLPSGSNILFNANSANLFAVNITVGTGALTDKVNDALSRLDVVEEDISLKRTGAPVGLIKKYSLLVATKPSDWVEAGAWSWTTSGLQSPGSGSWGTYAYWNKPSSLDEDAVCIRVQAVNASSVFAIVRKSQLVVGTSILEADLGAGKIKLYPQIANIGDTPGTSVAEIDIPFARVANREYLLTLRKDREIFYGKLVDTVTQESVQLVYNSIGGTSCGECVDAPGIIFRSGSIIIKDLAHTTAMPYNPYMTIVTDSIGDGDTIRNEPSGGYMNRWAGIVSARIKDNMFLSARGGDTTALSAAKLTDILAMIGEIKIFIYAIGVNDSNLTTWQNGKNAARAAVLAHSPKAEFIVITLPPRDDRAAYDTQVTNAVLAGPDRYLDFAKWMTTNGDRVTRENTLFLPDEIHPNVAGHAKLGSGVINELGL